MGDHLLVYCLRIQPSHPGHRCKKKFFLRFFLFLPFFTLLTFFILLNVFFKTCIENLIKGFVKHFQDYKNKLIGHSDVVYLVSPNKGLLNKKFC